MRQVRLTKVAWLLLQRLNQETAELRFCSDRRCSRFHFAMRGEMVDVVRQSTMDALAKAALLKRVSSESPRFGINQRGRQMLKERMNDAEFAAESGR